MGFLPGGGGGGTQSNSIRGLSSIEFDLLSRVTHEHPPSGESADGEGVVSFNT